MGTYQRVFKRYEKKYMLTEKQYRNLISLIYDKLEYDNYNKYTICNIYFDTLKYDVIQNSIEKPVYKEKLRIRSYGVPDKDSNVFIELKKKVDGIVYKRRVEMTWNEVVEYLIMGGRPPVETQITREIDWYMKKNRVYPMLYLAYDRVAMRAKENKDIRITFDTNIHWRSEDLDLTEGDYGHVQVARGTYIMEMKAPGSMPLWMAEALSSLKIYPISYSKYGMIYKDRLFNRETIFGGEHCA